MAVNQIYNQTLERDKFRESQRQSNLMRALQEAQFRSQLAQAERAMRFKEEQAAEDQAYREKVFDFDKQQAMTPKQQPFSLAEALYKDYKGGNRSPQVLEGLGMYVEPDKTPAMDTEANSASLAQQYGLIPVGVQGGKTKWGLPEEKPTGIPKETLDLATGLRKEFQASPIYKQAESVRSSALKMEQAFKLATNPDEKSRIASDQALGVLFQKLLDPTSVVRESEYARTPEGASAINRIAAIAPQLAKGGLALANDDREAIYDMAKKLQQVAEQQLSEKIEGYRGLAQEYSVPPNLVLGEYDQIKKQEPSAVNVNQQPIDAETQQKINIAKQYGYTDEEIQAYLGGM